MWRFCSRVRNSDENAVVAGVFISYRTDDTRPWAITIRDHLARTFGERQVFLDVDSIEAGQWRTQVDRALNQCAIVVLLIGRRWHTAADADGHARLLAVDDVHRYEVATALANPRVTVIPVLVDGASVPRAPDLPEDLRALLTCQAIEIADQRDVRAASLNRLTQLIDDRLGHRRMRRQAISLVAASAAVGVINTLIASPSYLVSVAFLLVALGIATSALLLLRRVLRERIRRAWIVWIAVILSAAMVIGSVARIAVAGSPDSIRSGALRR
jgi:hypothetical protein